MLGLFYLTGFIIYLLIAVTIAVSQYKKRRKKRGVIALSVFIVVMLLPFTDYFTQFFLVQTRIIFRQPLQVINEVIEVPGSVYWEDNVWPGFDEFGRNWMVEKYLDGKHLQSLALNGEDGNVYLYRYGQKEPQVYRTPDKLPDYNYMVTFNKDPLMFYERPFIWKDTIKITAIGKNETIGSSTRYCGYGWWLGIDTIGHGRFCRGYIKGDIQIYEFDDKVLFGFVGVRSSYEIDRSYLRR